MLRSRIAITSLIAVLAAFASPSPSTARPQYLREFAGKYDGLESIARQAKCAVCHCGKTKKAWNNYGAALKKTFGEEKNIKDRAAIDKALGEIESLPSHVPDKTFGDLIREGRLPGKPCGEKPEGDACGC